MYQKQKLFSITITMITLITISELDDIIIHVINCLWNKFSEILIEYLVLNEPSTVIYIYSYTR